MTIFFRKNTISLLGLLLIVVLWLADCSNEQLGDEIVAQVAHRTISAKQYRADFELTPKYPVGQKGEVAARAHLEQMIKRELLILTAEQSDLVNDDKIQARLRWIERAAVRDELYRQAVRDSVAVTEAELRAAFVQLNRQPRVRHLLVPTEEEALELLERIRAGEDFAELARGRFQDPNLAASGGDLGYVTYGTLEEEFERAAFALEAGQISEPVQTHWGWHLIKVEDIKRNVFLTEDDFKQKRRDLEKIIRTRREQLQSARFVREFMSSKNIHVNRDAFLLLFNESQKLTNGSDPSLPSHLPYLRDPEVQRLHSELVDHRDELLLGYEGGRWSVGEFLDRLPLMPVTQRPRMASLNQFRNDLAAMLRDELLAEEGYRRGLQHSPGVAEEVNLWRDELLSVAARKKIVAGVRVSEQEAEHYYNEHTYSFTAPKEIKIQAIAVASAAFADSLLRRAKAGEDIGQLARRYSQRLNGISRDGMLGYFPRGAHGVLGAQAFATPLGEFSGPLQLENGAYAIFKVIGYQSQALLPYHEVHERVGAAALLEKKAARFTAVIDSLRAHTTVRINEVLLRELAEKLDFEHRIPYVQVRRSDQTR